MSLRAQSALRVEADRSRGIRYSPLPADDRIRRVLQAIESGPDHSIQDLARMVNLSVSRLSHLFKAATGLSLQNFLTTCRLQIALELLHSTEMPIKEISYRAGYRHPPSFVRAFRNQFGASPSGYRSRQQYRPGNSRFD
ncbi:MAG: AraC family transcriptional regulator [Candidatus Korobacteraceae bacterium]